MDSTSLRLSKLTLFLHVADLYLDLGIGGDEHPTGKCRSILLFLSFRPYGQDVRRVSIQQSSLSNLVSRLTVHTLLFLYPVPENTSVIRTEEDAPTQTSSECLITYSHPDLSLLCKLTYDSYNSFIKYFHLHIVHYTNYKKVIKSYFVYDM